MTRSGGYFGIMFKGYRVVAQGYLLSPTLFNEVMDSDIRNWVTVVEPTSDGLEGNDLSVSELAAYFYDNDGLVLLNQLKRLQREFDVLNGLFDQVGLRTNTRKMVSMKFQPCHAPGLM